MGLATLLTGVLITHRSSPQASPAAPESVESQSDAIPVAVRPASSSVRPDCENVERSQGRAKCLFFKTLPADSIRAAQAINNHYAEQAPELHYWIREGVSKSEQTGLNLRDGPCGPYAMARSGLTTPPDRRLEADEIVEVAATGEVLRKWPVPESWLLGIIGDEVLVAYDLGGRTDLALAVATTGRSRVVPVDTYLRAETRKVSECPRYSGFGNSAYTVCSIVRQSDAVVRYLIWQAPCT